MFWQLEADPTIVHCRLYAINSAQRDQVDISCLAEALGVPKYLISLTFCIGTSKQLQLAPE